LALGIALEVIVKDGSGNPMSGVSVAWSAATGGGTVTPGSNTTGADGKVTATRTLGAAAVLQTTTATVTGLAPVTFHHTAQIQGATQIALDGGSGQTDTVLGTLTTQLSVLVRQETNTAVQGVNVTWTPPTGGKVNGAAVPTMTATNASGIATVTLTLGPTSGSQTATAEVTGLIGSPINFSATASAGDAVSLTAIGGTTTGGPGTVVTLSVQAKDQFGNNTVAGDTVAWTATAGGGSVNPDTSLTNANGVASTQHTLGPSDGKDSVEATAFGDTARFGLTIVSAPLVDTVTVGFQGGNVFSPGQITIASGGTVVFKWAAGVHGVKWLTVPAGATKPTDSANLSTGTVPYVLTTTGTYTYECTIHGAAMSGSVIVQ
jgi:adhesin/invasin